MRSIDMFVIFPSALEADRKRLVFLRRLEHRCLACRRTTKTVGRILTSTLARHLSRRASRQLARSRHQAARLPLMSAGSAASIPALEGSAWPPRQLTGGSPVAQPQACPWAPLPVLSCQRALFNHRAERRKTLRRHKQIREAAHLTGAALRFVLHEAGTLHPLLSHYERRGWTSG